MTINVASVGAGSAVALPASAVTSVALEDKLARCTRQLGDWEACASSKTPEGRKIIQNLRAQIGNLESRIRMQAAPASASLTPSLSNFGSLVNTFA